MTERRRPRRFEKQVEPRSVTYRLTRYVGGVPVSIEVYVAMPEYLQGRFVLARRLLRARRELNAIASLANASELMEPA